MKSQNIQFIINEKGEKSSVVLPMNVYLDMLEKLEELEDIRLYDDVKSRNEPSISIEEYRLIREKRKQSYALPNSNT